ncbi:unnamed protein product [Candidula unifasciata]|uniref:N-terminal acetyltransferase B complex subunit NAA25 homolog n=1 Tax=Candidula unifasciata TaxID=100452 RepID=A0A8S3YF97_9EUPU|nr:unnamed protein product [Candidula unifasciata]
MASRSHVDVNERRLRPIYDCLDNGNNKKAIQEADKVLKKQKDLTCAKVLKALALIRSGQMSKGSSLLAEIHQTEPTDEQTLSAMSICYKETQQYEQIASLYEAAAKHQPNNEDILSCLFMAHVRLGNYQQQQRTAMLLHKIRPNKNPYYFWAVMSIVMQAHADKKLGRTMYLPLAEKMTQKYLQDKEFEAEEILLYLIILELQEKWAEACAVLRGPMGDKLCSELNLRSTRIATVYTKLLQWDKANVIYKDLLNQTPDDWTFWLNYLETGFHMVDSGFTPTPGEEDSTVESMHAFLLEKLGQLEGGVLIRGPYLAQIEFLKNLIQRKSDLASSVGTTVKLLQDYFDKFGHKSCCYGDMKLYTHLLTEQELSELLDHMRTFSGLDDTEQFAQDINQLTQHLVYHQLSRTVGRHTSLSIDQALLLSRQLLLRYRDGLSFGKDLLKTDLQYSDNFLLLAVHLLLDVWIKTGDDVHVWQAIVHLELGIRESTSNYQFKLLLIRLYCIKGVFGPCPALYDSMEIKHIMNDTLGYIVSNHVIRLGHFVEAGTMYTTMVRFFVLNQREASEHLMSSYKFGSFGRIQEFVAFQDRLNNSLQFHTANTEKLLLDLIMQTDSHDATEEIVKRMNVHPLTDKQKLCDNRDLAIALCWDPPRLSQCEENKSRSKKEEEAWQTLRWLQLHILLLAVMSGREFSGASVINGNDNNQNEDNQIDKVKHKPLELMKNRMSELQEFVTKCQEMGQPQQYHIIQGPFRTRISELLHGEHIALLGYMAECVDYVHILNSKGSTDSRSEKSAPWNKVKENASKLVVKDVGGLLKDVNGKRQLDSSALEKLVASVETVSYLTILAGVCNRGLKPVKASWCKKSKKHKGPSLPQPEIFDNFNNLITKLSAITKQLHQTASGLDPVFSSIDIASLRLADIPEEEELEREAERLVWSKVERSIQQSSREICEVLHHKQFYLNTLML